MFNFFFINFKIQKFLIHFKVLKDARKFKEIRNRETLEIKELFRTMKYEYEKAIKMRLTCISFLV